MLLLVHKVDTWHTSVLVITTATLSWREFFVSRERRTCLLSIFWVRRWNGTNERKEHSPGEPTTWFPRFPKLEYCRNWRSRWHFGTRFGGVAGVFSSWELAQTKVWVRIRFSYVYYNLTLNDLSLVWGVHYRVVVPQQCAAYPSALWKIWPF